MLDFDRNYGKIIILIIMFFITILVLEINATKEPFVNEHQVVMLSLEEEAKILEEREILLEIETLNNALEYKLKDKGELIARYCAEKGVDPYLAVAIAMHETYRGAGKLITENNNVGGMRYKGKFLTFSTIDEGIKKFIDNLANNYYKYGLDTAEKMVKKYAENSHTWVGKVEWFYKEITSGRVSYKNAGLNRNYAHADWL